MDTDLDTLAVALYVRIDDILKDHPELVPWRPKIGIAPKLADAVLLALAVLQVSLGFNEEARWVRHVRRHLGHLFVCVPGQAGYNKRLRKSTMMLATTMLATMIRLLAVDTDVWDDDTWLIDSRPVECGRSRPTAKRSNLAGWASYGYCASHSRYFWGLRLHLVAFGARWVADRVRVDEPETRRTRSGLGHLRVRPGPARRPPRSTADRRQGVRVGRVRATARRSRCRIDPPGQER